MYKSVSILWYMRKNINSDFVKVIITFRCSSVLIWFLMLISKLISLVQSLSRVWFFATPWTAARQASLSITNSRSLLKLMSIESVMPSNHLILCCPILLCLNLPQHQGLFKWVSSSPQMAKLVDLTNSFNVSGSIKTRTPWWSVKIALAEVSDGCLINCRCYLIF